MQQSGPPSGHRHQPVVDVVTRKIDGLGVAPCRRHGEPLRHTIDAYDASSAQQPSAHDCHLADRPAAPHRDRVAGSDVGILGCHPARGQDIGQEEHLVVAQAGVDVDRAMIGMRHADKLGLPAGVAAVQMGIAEQAGAGLAMQLLQLLGVRIGGIAARPQLALAEEALAAGDYEGHHHPVAPPQPRHRRTGIYNLAHELVAKDITGLHLRHEAVVDVQVRATDRGGGGPDDDVFRRLDARIGNGIDAHVARAVPCKRFHECPRG
jgi:hypothetical protein